MNFREPTESDHSAVPTDWCLRERAYLRAHHRDLEGSTNDDLWSEQTVLSLALAVRLRDRRLDRRVVVDATRGPIRESVWLRERLDHIARELRVRGQR